MDAFTTGERMMTQLSDEVVERVARALVIARGGDPDRCLSGYSWEAGEMGRAEAGSVCHLRVWQDRVKEAEAAIAAYEAKGDIPLDEN